MGTEVKSFKDLQVWQKAILLVTRIYRVTARFPADETYGLTAQLRRAAVSVPSNIAEGHGRLTRGEYKHFLGQARGSLCEIHTQLTIASNLNYIPKKDSDELMCESEELSKMLHGLLRALGS
ncbi:MAG: four helix bundle protein [Acidobacteriales bacterium]|nr:four helix bundle protein [Terriglobales bacterium]